VDPRGVKRYGASCKEREERKRRKKEKGNKENIEIQSRPMDDVPFVTSILRDMVLLKPQMLGSNYREVVTDKLKSMFEGTCSRHGFVLKGSISIHRIVSARVEAASLNGDVRYDVQYLASVCNPPVGSVLPARVVNSNSFGMMLHSGVTDSDGTFSPIVEIIVPLAPMDPSQETNPSQASTVTPPALVGEAVHVELIGKKFKLNDPRICAIGKMSDSAAMRVSEDVRASSLNTIGMSALSYVDADGDVGINRGDVHGEMEDEDEDVYATKGDGKKKKKKKNNKKKSGQDDEEDEDDEDDEEEDEEDDEDEEDEDDEDDEEDEEDEDEDEEDEEDEDDEEEEEDDEDEEDEEDEDAKKFKKKSKKVVVGLKNQNKNKKKKKGGKVKGTDGDKDDGGSSDASGADYGSDNASVASSTF
jgi:DNA-directed RNA polymerase subunit E'/Rpb7